MLDTDRDMRTSARRWWLAFLGGAAVLLFSCSLPRAVGSPSEEPCRQARTQAELAACWSRVAADAERRLHDRHAEALSLMREKNAGGAATQLEAAQVTWTAYRDAHCGVVAKLFDTGTAKPMQMASCRARLAQQRTADLDALLTDWGQAR